MTAFRKNFKGRRCERRLLKYIKGLNLLFQTFLLPLPPHFSFISPALLPAAALVPVCENSERFLLSWKKVQISVGLLGFCLRAEGFCFAFLFCFFFVGVILFLFIFSLSKILEGGYFLDSSSGLCEKNILIPYKYFSI